MFIKENDLYLLKCVFGETLNNYWVFFYFTIIIVILFVCLPQLILLCPKKDF